MNYMVGTETAESPGRNKKVGNPCLKREEIFPLRIEIEKKKCTGCHLCEMVCSLSHLGVLNPSKSAIRILKDDLADRSPYAFGLSSM